MLYPLILYAVGCGWGWVTLIMSKKNEIFNNWSDNRLKTDMSIPSYWFWPSRTNKYHDNYFHEDVNTDWPIKAQEVMNFAGLTDEFQVIKQEIDRELSKGYIPLVELFFKSKN